MEENTTGSDYTSSVTRFVPFTFLYMLILLC